MPALKIQILKKTLNQAVSRTFGLVDFYAEIPTLPTGCLPVQKKYHGKLLTQIHIYNTIFYKETGEYLWSEKSKEAN